MSTFEVVEIWKDIPGFEGYYQASNLGNIKTLARLVVQSPTRTAMRSERVLKQKVSHDGRMQISLSIDKVRSYYNVHRLIAFCFIGEQPSKLHEINHKDGNPQNNFYQNLEWVSKSYNIKHAWQIGLKNQDGEKNPSSKLTEKDVYEIRDLTKHTKLKNKEIAEMYSVSDSLIYQVKTYKIWKHLEE